MTLLFSSYLGVQVIAMLITGAFSARFGAKRTVVTDLILIVLATLACALASSITQLVALRAVWGLGNAFFIATALSVIVSAASGGRQGVVLLYKAALGIGLSTGPLLGVLLGHLAWRGPFAGTAADVRRPGPLRRAGLVSLRARIRGHRGVWSFSAKASASRSSVSRSRRS